MTDALDVYLHDDRVGTLERLSQARLRFVYEPSWIAKAGAGLSFSLPVREQPFEDQECRPFFEGLIPEGDFLKAIARAFGISADNPFAVLAEIGGECAGAVSLVPVGAIPPIVSAPPPEWVSEEHLAHLLDELPQRPLLAGEEEGIRLSLAGTQDKLPVLFEDDRIGITRGRPPSTHIVKTPIARVPDTVANEAYCMSLASAIGLRAAEAHPDSADGREFLLVRRYDREHDAGDVKRIHQEDLCQALGVVPALKYENDGGPGIAACAQLLREHSAAPAVDLLAFLDALLLNAAIANHDAHAKNYSLLLEGNGAPRLAPLYDLVSTWAYGRPFGRKLAMRYGGEYRLEYLRGRHLDRLAGDLKMSPRAVRDRALQLVDRVIDSLAPTREKLPEPWRSKPILDSIVDLTRRNAALIGSAAKEPG